ncbi:hypothetical protein EDEG_04026 [Edhazardia aedis USNM 41457]|uniref:Uncharacterized protein n=1 Tax=Edhazardia aedis (strain USNM 41457) TaxID=1003232 RepID=J9DFC4_EDHAE|nr:hypothetical protein EDEG_04026 [Edhazardia aedis USNM 41457]|eukprot:EJW01305.1 hypothetical protein EDEG_04026 [Edhazardia aedis USNM 41457]
MESKTENKKVKTLITTNIYYHKFIVLNKYPPEKNKKLKTFYLMDYKYNKDINNVTNKNLRFMPTGSRNGKAGSKHVKVVNTTNHCSLLTEYFKKGRIPMFHHSTP